MDDIKLTCKKKKKTRKLAGTATKQCPRNETRPIKLINRSN